MTKELFLLIVFGALVLIGLLVRSKLDEDFNHAGEFVCVIGLIGLVILGMYCTIACTYSLPNALNYDLDKKTKEVIER